MEKQLKFTLMLTLREMALRRVSVILWSGPDTLATISKFGFYKFCSVGSRKEWREAVEEKIKSKIRKLELPASLTNRLIDLVRPISFEIRTWRVFEWGKFFDFFFSSSGIMGFPDSPKLCWTTFGTIDYRRTAETLIRCDALDVKQRYEMACLYCLEDYIPHLWKKPPKDMKRYYYKIKASSPLHYLDCYMPGILNEMPNIEFLPTASDENGFTFNRYALYFLAERGFKAGVEYFFLKMTHKEKEASVMRSAQAVLAKLGMGKREEKLSDVLCYLLSVMSPEQQMEIIKAHPVDALLCFLYWPWQDLFLENAALILDFLPQSDYDQLLSKMANRFENSEHYSPYLFQEFFRLSPLGLKRCFVGQESENGGAVAYRFLSLFFDFKDSESIEVVFRNVDAVDRVRLVFHVRTLSLFYSSMLKDRLQMVEICLQEAALSESERKSLKGAFMLFLKRNVLSQVQRESSNLKRLFEIIEGTNASSCNEKKGQKRKLEN